MRKEVEVERKSFEDVERILREAKSSGIDVVVIGGYAVKAYSPRTMRYTKDIDLAVKKSDLNKLRFVLKKIGYQLKDRPHGLSGFRRVGKIPIILNVSAEDIRGKSARVKSFYGETIVEMRVARIEDLLILKARAARERDIIDISLLLLDSFDVLNVDRLKGKLGGFKREFLELMKSLVDLIGTKKFRAVWKDFMGRAIEKDEERKLWKNLNYVIRGMD